MSKNGVPWGTILLLGAGAVGIYLLYKLFKDSPIISTIVDTSKAVVGTTSSMADAITTPLTTLVLPEGGKAAETITDYTKAKITEQGIAAMGSVLFPPATIINAATNLFSSKAVANTKNLPTVSVISTNVTPPNVTGVSSKYQLDVINKFVTNAGLLGW